MSEGAKKLDKQFLVMFIVLVLMFVGILYGIFAFQKAQFGGELRFDYNGFDVGNTQQGYRMQIYINDQETPQYFTLRTDPRETDDIMIERSVLDLKNKKELFAVINPDDGLTGSTTMAVLEVDKILDNPHLFNIPMSAGFLIEKEGGLDVITCEDATDEFGVLWFRLGESTRVFEEDGCFVLEGVTEDDLIRAADRVILVLLGIAEI